MFEFIGLLFFAFVISCIIWVVIAALVGVGVMLYVAYKKGMRTPNSEQLSDPRRRKNKRPRRQSGPDG